MTKKIKITVGGIEVLAELNDSETAGAIYKKLPIEAKGEFRGDEIFCDIGMAMDSEDPRELVQEGDLGYWPPGNAFCIFYGPTPTSREGEIRPFSPVNAIGKVLGDAKVLKAVKDASKVKIEKA
jgi:hypothetical protein